MYNHMHVNFFFRKSLINPEQGAIYVRVTVNKTRQTLGAVTVVSSFDVPKSIMIQSSNWDQPRQRVKPADPQAIIINKAIEECDNKLRKVYAQHEGFDKTMTIRGVKSVVCKDGRMLHTLPDLVKLFLDEKLMMNVKASTIDTYHWKLKVLLDFLKQETLLESPAESFSPGTLRRFRSFLIGQRSNADRNADKCCQVVKTVLIWAAEHEHIQRNPLLNVRVRVDKTPNLECVSQDELDLIRKARLIPVMRKAADCFEFACYTGLAYQDMFSLVPSSVQVVEGKRCIVGQRMKTGTDFCIPISGPVQALIDKYGGVNLPLPKLNDYNPLLRQIMFTVGIDKKITSHTARKTFADWLINELNLTEEAAIVAMGQKAAKELTPYRKIRPKRLLNEFPDALLAGNDTPTTTVPGFPFRQVHKAS